MNRKTLHFSVALIAACILCNCWPGSVLAQNTNDAKGHIINSGNLWVPIQIDELPTLKMGPFVRLDNGNILTVEETKSLISADEGKTWQTYEIFGQDVNYQISNERALLKTQNGIVIVAFMNLREKRNWKWQPNISDSPGATLPTCTVRSLDGGKTWEKPQKLHNEWTGAIRDMIETRNGNIIFTSMMMRHAPAHHTVLTYTSKNEGASWERSNVIDLGGIGNHSGVTESTIEQLGNGKIWQLMRTNWGTFWEAFSDDEGITWQRIRPTNIAASSSPGMIKRLASGRLIFLWNRPFPEGKDTYPTRGGDSQWSEVAASNFREELSMAFSNDDGKSWSKPHVIARSHAYQNEDSNRTWISYPYVFESNPGELWITTMQGGLRVKLQENNFIN